MYLAPACFFWLLLGVAAIEWPAMQANNALQLIADKPITYFAAAAMGFCVNLLAYMVIQTASSLTLKVPREHCLLCNHSHDLLAHLFTLDCIVTRTQDVL